jgi:preprotein translocase subunit SecF
VLMRSLNTSVVAIMPIVSILVIGAGVLGATTLNDFGLALFVGLLTGAYSSIYIAAPVLAMLKEREPRYASVRQRLTAKGGHGLLTPASAAALVASGNAGASPASSRPRPAAKGGRPKPVVRDAPADDDADDLLVPARRTSPNPQSAKAEQPPRPKPVPRPGAPRPRKKGKKR